MKYKSKRINTKYTYTIPTGRRTKEQMAELKEYILNRIREQRSHGYICLYEISKEVGFSGSGVMSVWLSTHLQEYRNEWKPIRLQLKGRDNIRNKYMLFTTKEEMLATLSNMDLA